MKNLKNNSEKTCDYIWLAAFLCLLFCKNQDSVMSHSSDDHKDRNHTAKDAFSPSISRKHFMCFLFVEKCILFFEIYFMHSRKLQEQIIKEFINCTENVRSADF